MRVMRTAAICVRLLFFFDAALPVDRDATSFTIAFSSESQVSAGDGSDTGEHSHSTSAQ